MRTITMSGGPLNGLSFDIPDDADRVDHHATDGHYTADGDWVPNVETLDEALEAVLAELKPSPSTGISGIVSEARSGRRVLVVAKSKKRAVELWSEVLAGSEHDDATLRRAPERAEFASGGFIRPVGLNTTGGRGVTADTLYVDGPDLNLTDLLPCLSAARDPRVLIHAGADRG